MTKNENIVEEELPLLIENSHDKPLEEDDSSD
jgi:hypothetical protein